MNNLLELGRYDEPHPEFLIIQDMLNTLYSKSDQFQRIIEEVENKEGLHQFEKESMVNSYGLSSCYMDETIVKYLTISIAALYERILKEFHEKTLRSFSGISKLKNAKGNEVRDLVKVTKHYLNELGVSNYFEDDLFKHWVVLVKLRNVFTHDYYGGEQLSRTIEKTREFVESYNMELMVKCNITTCQIQIEREYFEACLNDVIRVVTKFEIIANDSLHAFEDYVMDENGYLDADYDSIASWRKEKEL